MAPELPKRTKGMSPVESAFERNFASAKKNAADIPEGMPAAPVCRFGPNAPRSSSPHS